MTGKRLAGLGLVLSCWFGTEALAQCTPDGVNDGPLQVTKGSLDVRMRYTDNNFLECGAEGNYFSQVQAQHALNAMAASYDLFTLYGFPEPYVEGDPIFRMVAYDSGNIGTLQKACITIDAPSRRCSPELRVRKTVHHEEFHAIQVRYMDNNYDDLLRLGAWVFEGTARCVDDRMFSDLDGETYSSTFWAEVGVYMENTDVRLTQQSYAACLFWSYLCEQLGTSQAEPQRGIDFLRKYFERIDAYNTTNGMRALRDEIVASGGGSLNQMWHDFSVAVVAREFDPNALPRADRFRFVDEMPGNGDSPPYPDVLRAQTLTGMPQMLSDRIEPYASKYYEVSGDFSPCDAIGAVGAADKPVAWSLLGITPDDRLVYLSQEIGREFGRTMLFAGANNIDRVILVVAGLEHATDFDVQFDSGDPTVSVIRPDFSRPARPGPASDPGRFLVRVVVEGPDGLKPPGIGPRSILGLRPPQFFVRVGDAQAQVLTAAYVGNEYWLTCQAPPQPADGYYNCDVRLYCAGTTETQVNAVLYGEVTVNHVVVIDRSGSMSDPVSNPKINAARNAASLYVDSVSTTDRVAVVAFDGDGTDCNDDAVVLEALDFAFPAQRASARADIAGITPGGWTAIGDGLWKGQDELDATSRILDINTMVLLSDGEENEARYWKQASSCDTASSRVLTDDTIINTIAFGPESNQSLMHEIAYDTLGDYTYVDVSGVASFAPTIVSLSNSLAEAYVTSLQRSRNLERLFFQNGAVAPGSFEVEILVEEAGIEEAVFFLNWNNAAAIGNIELQDPNGVVINGALAEIFTTTTHKVYQIPKMETPGTWRLTFDASSGADYIAGLLGRQRKGVDLHLLAYQINTGGVQQEADQGPFEHGVPVNILGILTDTSGPVLDAELLLTVRLPDGTDACGPLRLFDDGAHSDGNANDGIYGAVFTQTAQAGTPGGVDNDTGSGSGSPERGTYRIEVNASGTSALTGDYTRQASTSFHIYQGRDEDGDGIPDTHEIYYGTDPLVPSDTNDGDEDGLIDVEEFLRGTNPLDPDTDNGGETDGSEVQAGRCPIEPTDDTLPCPTDFEIVTQATDLGTSYLLSNALLLRFPVHPSYDQMEIWRRNPGDPSFNQIDLVDLASLTGLYYDENVNDGDTYEYQVRAIGVNGETSCYSEIASATAKDQPRPPRGWVTINNEACFTDRLDVLVRLDAGAVPDDESRPTLFRIANGSLTGLPFTPLPTAGTPFSWSLSPGGPGLRTVHVQFMDDEGNVSQIYNETIPYDPFGDYDNDGNDNQTDDDDDNDNLDDTLEINLSLDTCQQDSDGDGLNDGDEIDAGTNPRNPDTDGDGLLDGVDPDPLSAPCDGDANGDNVVDLTDLSLVLANFGASGAGLDGDINEDGNVDLTDLGLVLANFGCS